MKRLILFPLAAALLAGCQSDGTGARDNVALVQLMPGDRTLAVGETLPLEVVVRLESGDTPDSLEDADFRSSAPGVATVDATGKVTGVAPGTAEITASLEGRTGSVLVRVALPPGPCTPGSARTLAVGEAVVLGGVAASTACVTGGAAGADFVAVPFHGGGLDDDPLGLTLTGQSVLALSGATPSLAAFRATAGPRPNEEFHIRLRERAAGALAPHFSTALSMRAAGEDARGPRFTLNLRSPSVGDQVQVNTQVDEACEDAKMSTGRVVAISNRAIVLADVANPANGLTTADYQSFALQFDTLVYPTVTNAFGVPQDVDENGKVVIFYSRAVNELTPRGSGSYVGGFFYSRDLFPTRDRKGLSACAGSNYAELFYMLVPDPTGVVNGNVFSRNLVVTTTVGTLAHEFQHLINASRKLYVTKTVDWNEDTWLNEGMSHITEELMFYRASGKGPRQNLTSGQAAPPGGTGPYLSYMDQNIRRYAEYLEDPEHQSPYDNVSGEADDLATRGAGWAFLRYAADRRGGDENTLWRGLVDSNLTGFGNLKLVLGVDPREWIRDWTTSVYTDDLVATEARFQQPSWNFRSFFGTYPLAVRSLNGAQNLLLSSGSGAFVRFSVGPALTGAVNLRSGGSNPPSQAFMTVVRTR
ncbi:MAG TPA: Ig-like domain-containing protein [Longimicrobium sp.]|jgi:hypothetical protein|uniref:Ig-like domain-containing protein n=1 Tax=Longimicrobium sp. TaxID=2029185 RepID=UPI002EDA569B